MRIVPDPPRTEDIMARRLPDNLPIVIAWTVRTAVGLAALVLAIGIFGALLRSKPAPERRDPDALVPRVRVLTAAELEVRRTWTGFGVARAMAVADVPARVASTVVAIPEGVEDGAPLGPDGVIVRLDDSDFVARVAAADQILADLDAQIARVAVDDRRLRDRLELVDERVGLAEAELTRVLDAQRQNAALPREADAARSALAAVRSERATLLAQIEGLPSTRASLSARRAGADAERRLASLAVERCVIVNPLGPGANGTVLQRVDVEPGESVVPGQRVARVVDPSRLEVPIRLPASARRWLEVGDEARLSPAGSDEEPVTARVARIAPEDDAATRTVTVFVEFVQSTRDPGAIAPGRFVRAEVRRGTPERRVVVPRRSLDGDRMYVLDEDGRVRGREARPDFAIRERFPSTGLPDEDWVVLVDAPDPGTRIVLTPTRRLADGLRIEPVEPGRESGP